MVYLIAILTGLSVVLLGAALFVRRSEKNAADLARRRAMQDRDVVGDGHGRPRLMFTVQRTGEIVSKGKTSRPLREKLAAAGYHSPSASAVYLGSKVILFGTGVLVFSALFFQLR